MQQYDYKKEKVNIHFTQYARGGPALLMKTLEGEPMLTLTVYLDTPLAHSEIVIKTYSENEGIFEWMLDNNIITDTGRRVRSGFVELPIGKLL